MKEKEELKRELKNEIQLVKYRIKMLDIMEEKLLTMRQLADKARQENPNKAEKELLNAKLNDLAAQVRALDGESRVTEDGKVILDM